MKTCSVCSAENRDVARRCKHCLEPLEIPGDPFQLLLPERAIGIAAEFAIFGGLLMACGPFLPFAESGEYSNGGLLDTGLLALLMVCSGAIVAVFGALSLLQRRRYIHWYLLCSALTAAITLYYQLAVESHLVYEGLTRTALGLGIHFCYLGSAFTFVAAAVCLVRRPNHLMRARLATVANVAHNLSETAFRRVPPSVLESYERLVQRRHRR